MSEEKKFIVTHHAPDMDAVGAVWILKRFDPNNYADAGIAFVDAGQRLTLQEANALGVELHNVVHVDTGLGRFDHHQLELGKLHLSASALVYEYVVSIDPNLKKNRALKYISEYITDIDHFADVGWPDAGTPRKSFSISSLIRGAEFNQPHDDDSQLHFGMTCLDNAYAILVQFYKADEILTNKGRIVKYEDFSCLYLESRNDDTIKLAQERGIELVVRKDPRAGHIRIKARPDSDLDLERVYKRIKELDKVGTWFFHPSGKMLLNGSDKTSRHRSSPLSLQEIEAIIKDIYE